MTSAETLHAATLRLDRFGGLVVDDRLTPAEHQIEPSSNDMTVTVVVPTYGDGSFLVDALSSIRNQTVQNWKCIIVDDASPDDVDTVVGPFLEDRRFSLARHGKNAGLAAARNTGLRLVTTDLVQFLDADDMLTPWALEERIEAFRDHRSDPTVAGTYGQVIQCPVEVTLADLSGWKRRPELRRRDWLESDGESPFTVHAPLTRTDVLIAVGGFDESFVNGAEDWDLWHRILRHGYVYLPSRSIVGAYRQRPSSMVRHHARVHFGRAEELIERSNRWAITETSASVGNSHLPIDVARMAHLRTIRAARWAGLQSLVHDDPRDAVTDEIVDFARFAGLTTRRDDYVGAARAGVVRALGLSFQNVAELPGRSIRVLNELAETVTDELLARQLAHDQDVASGEALDLRSHRIVDVMLLAETVADIDELVALARSGGEGMSMAAVDLDYLKGDEGATGRWKELGVELVPVNSLYLGRCRPRVLVARRPAGPATLELLEFCASWGCVVRFLEEADRRLSVDESPSPPSPVETVAADALDVLVGTIDRSPSFVPNVGGRFSLLLPREESQLDPVGRRRLLELRDSREGETVVVIGNGPSLNDTNLDLLRGHATIGVNSIFLADEKLPEPLSYYVVEDTAVFDDNVQAIKDYRADLKLFPSIYRHRFMPDEIDSSTIFFRMNMGFYGRSSGTLCHPRFSMNASDRMFCGQSVTIINLQLAHWLGFTRVVMIGMDFSYVIPSDAERDGNRIVSRSDDPNHFHPDYFGAGKTWKDPKLDRVLINYRLAHDVYRATGREVVNATVGGRLDEFPRMTLAEALA